MAFDFQSYIAQHKVSSTRQSIVFENYAYVEDMQRLRQLAGIPGLSRIIELGMTAWKMTDRPRLRRKSYELGLDERLPRLWREVCARFGVTPMEVRIVPGQEQFFAPYGDGKDVFFGLSVPAASLPSAALRFVFGQGLGAWANGHVPYMTLMRFANSLTYGVLGKAAQWMDLLLRWQRAAAVTQDRAGMLACRDVSAAILMIMKSELDWEDDEIMKEIRRYHNHLDVDWGTREVAHRVRALSCFLQSDLYAQASGHLVIESLPMEKVDEEVQKSLRELISV